MPFRPRLPSYESIGVLTYWLKQWHAFTQSSPSHIFQIATHVESFVQQVPRCIVVGNFQVRCSSPTHSHRLIPRNSHPAHDLFNGRLLEPVGVDPDGDDPVVSICEDCLQQEANHLPKHSLENRLWIGRTP